jgi:uncharacterized protein (DUF2336 family)
LPLVRSIIAEELKHSENIPHCIVRRLADDVEEIVAALILEYSPPLSVLDLLEIILGGLKGGALVALSKHNNLTVVVADTFAETKDETAIGVFLTNQSAQIRGETLNSIVDDAPNKPSWHQPIAKRDNLPNSIMQRIATFVSASLVEMLIEPNQLREDLIAEIQKTVRKRIYSGVLTE